MKKLGFKQLCAILLAVCACFTVGCGKTALPDESGNDASETVSKTSIDEPSTDEPSEISLSKEEWGNLPFEEQYPPDNSPIEHDCGKDGHRFVVTAYRSREADLKCERCGATEERSAGNIEDYECDPSLFSCESFDLLFFSSAVKELIDPEIRAAGGYTVITGYKGSAEKVRVPGEINGKKVVALNGAFYKNNTLKSVILDEGILTVRDSFFNCTSLCEVWFGEDLRVVEGHYSFFGCPLSEVWLPTGLQELEGFKFCNFEKICLPCDGTFFAYGNPLTDITFTEGYKFNGTYNTAEKTEHLLLAMAQKGGKVGGGIETSWMDGERDYLAVPFEGAKWDFTVSYSYDKNSKEGVWDCRYFLDDSVWE